MLDPPDNLGVSVACAQHLVWLLLSAILWLGNVGFEPDERRHGWRCAATRRSRTRPRCWASAEDRARASALSERTLSAGGGPGMPVSSFLGCPDDGDWLAGRRG